jgi:hypothetical protein
VETLAAVAAVQSRFNPLSILVNGKPLVSQDLGEAVSRAVEELQAGNLVRIGLIGLGAQQAVSHGGSLLDAFDGCKSLGLASDSLAAAQAAREPGDRPGDGWPSAALEEFYRKGGADSDAAKKFAEHVTAAQAAEAAVFGRLMAARTAMPIGAAATVAAAAGTGAAANPVWNVYGSNVGAGVLVFSKQEKDKQ